MKLSALALVVTLSSASPMAAYATPIPTTFKAHFVDKTAIEVLLQTYTHAVSTKNQALFETLLLNKEIPFSGVGDDNFIAGKEASTRNYEAFRKGVFEGRPFTQHFQDVLIQQDGALATVTLVFTNKGPGGSSWGWKSMQLLKVNQRWKIASEFFTGHS